MAIKVPMEKPEGCYDCPFAKWEFEWVTCTLLQEETCDEGEDYNFDCPISEED